MLRTVADQPSLWEAILPEELRRLPLELSRVDALLDDPVFFTPFVPFFDPRLGRPSTPMETYLRLMFLKFRYRLGFESLCREVSDSLPLGAVLPDRDRPAGAAPDDADETHTRCGSAAGATAKPVPLRGSAAASPAARRPHVLPTIMDFYIVSSGAISRRGTEELLRARRFGGESTHRS
jgi:IS5 family transposase